MEKIICFFCDITGTLKGRNKNSDLDYKNLVSNLLKLMEKFEANCLLISLVSTDKYDVVNNTKKELQDKLNSSVFLFNKIFFENGYIVDDKINYKRASKPDQIIEFLDELEKKFDIQSIIYADDCEIFHEVVDSLAEEKNYHSKIISIIPQKKEGLSELNDLLESKILKKEKRLSYKII